MDVIVEKEVICRKFNYEDHIHKCYDYAPTYDSTGIKWEAPAYYMAKRTYENSETGRLKAINALVLFKNNNVYEGLDKEYIFNVLDEKFKTHQFKSEIDFFYGRVLDNGTIEWGLQVNGENPPF